MKLKFGVICPLNFTAQLEQMGNLEGCQTPVDKICQHFISCLRTCSFPQIGHPLSAAEGFKSACITFSGNILLALEIMNILAFDLRVAVISELFTWLIFVPSIPPSACPSFDDSDLSQPKRSSIQASRVLASISSFILHNGLSHSQTQVGTVLQ